MYVCKFASVYIHIIYIFANCSVQSFCLDCSTGNYWWSCLSWTRFTQNWIVLTGICATRPYVMVLCWRCVHLPAMTAYIANSLYSQLVTNGFLRSHDSLYNQLVTNGFLRNERVSPLIFVQIDNFPWLSPLSWGAGLSPHCVPCQHSITGPLMSINSFLPALEKWWLLDYNLRHSSFCSLDFNSRSDGEIVSVRKQDSCFLLLCYFC